MQTFSIAILHIIFLLNIHQSFIDYSLFFPNPKNKNVRILPKQMPAIFNTYNKKLCLNNNMFPIASANPETAIGGIIAAEIAIPVTDTSIFGLA